MSDPKGYFPDGRAYDLAMGRLSRVAGARFLDWLSLPDGLRWLDVGCGTGSFTELILDRNAPGGIAAIDPSREQIAFANGKPSASRVKYRQGDATSLPFGDGEFDVAVMALVIQYVPDPARAMSEIARVVRPGGTVAAYVWPGPEDGHPMRLLNEALKSVGGPPRNRPGNQVRTIDSLVALFHGAGLTGIDSQAIDIAIEFEDFEDCWSSQSAMVTLGMNAADTDRLKAALRKRVPADETGRIAYDARANAIRGRVPER